jgi:CYTH domain-containing protein
MPLNGKWNTIFLTIAKFLNKVEGRLAKLVLAEIEFTTDEAMAEFEPPDFCTVEVTNDPFFTDGHLATVQAETLHQALLVRFQAYDAG